MTLVFRSAFSKKPFALRVPNEALIHLGPEEGGGYEYVLQITVSGNSHPSTYYLSATEAYMLIDQLRKM